ncbi:hypothetical protein [Nocardioides sp. zg-DK7169]|uniref:hypothetical protein n=1 Tax=Nocardioides sp. zg-DK7169 TaxID=2736600 RepID=UPI001552056C|nr:hypothetical protein [Nocardioides sp. zg-DK7169]NPC97260.1 hypothetical protein [Nocardioides sp. zg-DK7169]
MNDLRSRDHLSTPAPQRRMTMRRRWRHLRQHPNVEHQVIRTVQLAALAVLLVITAVLVYRALTVV